MATGHLEACRYCGALVPHSEGAIHRYMLSSAGCFAIFSELLAQQYENSGYAAVGNLFQDAYCLQHPGENNPQAISHVAVHSISLYAQLEMGIHDSSQINNLRQRATMPQFKSHYVWLKPPGPIWDITIADIYLLTTVQDYQAKVQDWAKHTWDGWSKRHPQLVEWYRLVTA